MKNRVNVYNTLNQQKEELVPLQDGRISMYVCGITAYDHAHIGHARAAVIFDVIYRYLKYRGYQVTYVRNFTDVDDKIIKRSNEEGTSSAEIAARYITSYREDMKALGVVPPDHEPLATQHISDMIDVIQALIERGHAYIADGDVYFEVATFPEYGKLSKKNIEEQLAGARVETDDRKKDPRDFALWKKAKPQEPSWPSPWGDGRPGWHIECTAMSQKYIGETIDIHGGGRDLIFPHHENEIAQAEAASGKSFVRYWLHNGFVNINHEKMSKSLGNFFTIKEILRQYHPEVIRLFLLSHHYRSPVDFSPESMQEAEAGLERMYTTVSEIEKISGTKEYPPVEESRLDPAGQEVYREVEALLGKFEAAMDEDFNTAISIGHIFHAVRALNKYLPGLTSKCSEPVCALLAYARTVFSRIGDMLGILQVSPADYLEMVRNRRLSELDITLEEIERLVQERNQARRDKDWARSDAIRQDLLAKGILLEDGRGTTVWKIK
ncbi:MAG: cysteine--tRNA ligase [Deltaproteobacteria bacterium]|nr:cysteine--tRNA ligase [Deltaproteobacteria bacterium]